MKAVDRYIEDQKRSIRYKKLIDILTKNTSNGKETKKVLEITPGINNN